MIRGSGGSKRRVAKAAVAELVVQHRNEKLHTAVAPSTFVSQNVQSTSAPDRFLKFRNVQNTAFLDHFLKFRCRKMECRCGAKHGYKSKWTKYLCFEALFEVSMSQRCLTEEINRLILNQSINPSIINQSINQSIKQSINQSVSQSVSQLVKVSCSLSQLASWSVPPLVS